MELPKVKLLIISFLVASLIAVLGNNNAENYTLRIVASRDAAGMMVSFAAEMGIALTRLADCCGIAAEVALEAGIFDMAVLCPDAAKILMQHDDSLKIVGGIVKNANVLASKTHDTPLNIGYTVGRSSQRKAAKASYGESNLIPLATAALPFALESGQVDAIVLDILTATESEIMHILRPLPHDVPTSVLVVNAEIIDTQLYKDFISTYNSIIKVTEMEPIWKAMGTSFISIE